MGVLGMVHVGCDNFFDDDYGGPDTLSSIFEEVGVKNVVITDGPMGMEPRRFGFCGYLSGNGLETLKKKVAVANQTRSNNPYVIYDY